MTLTYLGVRIKAMSIDYKDGVDVAAASTGILALAAWLPPTASLFTIVWLGIRIFETKTVQKLLGRQ